MATATSEPADCTQTFNLLATNDVHLPRGRETDRQGARRGVDA
jgi:hypothetical protein